MTRDPRTLLRVVWCAVPSLAVMMTGDIHWLVAVVVMALIPTFGLSKPTARWRAVARRVSTWTTMAYLLFFLLDLFVLSERLIFAIVHLTFYLKLYTLLHQDRARERSRLHLLCLFEMLAAASMTVAALFVVPLGLFIVLGTLVLTLEQTRPARIDRTTLRGAAATSFVVAVPLVLLAGVVFVALPRASYGGFRLGGLTGVTVTGFSEQVRLGDFEEIRRDSGVVMRILSDGTDVSAPRWRGPAYDRYREGEWRQTLNGVSALPQRREGRFTLARPTASSQAFSEVFVEPLDTDVLFLPPSALSIDTTERYVFVDMYLTLRTGRSRRAGRHYTVAWRHLDDSVSSPIGAVEQLSEHTLGLYTQVPESLSSRFHDLSRSVAEGAAGLDAARRVERFLKDTYGYTLTPPERAHDDPLEDFLFGSGAGHCEYFATAMVMMLRSRGVPSRLVTGFTRGVQNEVGEFEVVRKSNAHAWVEVLDDRRGWVAFDPTPPSLDVEEEARGGVLSQSIDSLRMLWDMYVVAFDVERQRGVLGQASELGDRAMVAAYNGLDALKRHYKAALLVMAGLIGLWLVLRTKWGVRFRLRWLSPVRPQSSVAFYEKLLVLLSRLGIDKPPGQTAYTFARERESDLPGITELTRLYYRARFRGEILSRDEALHAQRLCNTIRLAALSDARRHA